MRTPGCYLSLQTGNSPEGLSDLPRLHSKEVAEQHLNGLESGLLMAVCVQLVTGPRKPGPEPSPSQWRRGFQTSGPRPLAASHVRPGPGWHVPLRMTCF